MDTQNTTAINTKKDPVCGMSVDPSRAKATHEHAGEKYYFCCVGCKEKFSGDPAKYLAPKALMGIAPAPVRPVQIAPAAAHGSAGSAHVAGALAHAAVKQVPTISPTPPKAPPKLASDEY